ncbi:MAG TPA: hypothetical protein VFV50_12940 [Bdellovibrionales bacterium]|nr:hypothetical protein [Bdellovibrionales bacterium]
MRVLILGLLLWSGVAGAQERFENFVGIRSLGMGGTATAVVNDETALLANPAALGKLRTYIVTIADPEISANATVLSAAGGRSTADLFSPQGLASALAQNQDKPYHTKIQLFPSFVVPNFGFGVFAKYSYDFEYVSSRTAGQRLRVDYTNDYAFVLGYSLRLFDGRVKIGVAGRIMNRVEAHTYIDETSTSIGWGDFVSEGGAIAGDGGIILTAPWKFLPTLAATIHDIGRTTFNQGEGVFYKNGRKPADAPQTVDVGIALFPIHANNLRSTFTVEYKDVLTYSEETDQMRRIHAGLEINFADFMFFRGGMNQRYWTAGGELAIQKFQFQAATYGEEIGTPTAPREDRRFIGKFSFRF